MAIKGSIHTIVETQYHNMLRYTAMRMCKLGQCPSLLMSLASFSHRALRFGILARPTWGPPLLRSTSGLNDAHTKVLPKGCTSAGKTHSCPANLGLRRLNQLENTLLHQNLGLNFELLEIHVGWQASQYLGSRSLESGRLWRVGF